MGLPFPESLYQLRSGLDLSDPASQFLQDQGIGVSATAAELNIDLHTTATGKLTVFHPVLGQAQGGSGQRVVWLQIEVLDEASTVVSTIAGESGPANGFTAVSGRAYVVRENLVLPAGFTVRVHARYDSLVNANIVTGSFVAWEIPAGTVRR